MRPLPLSHPPHRSLIPPRGAGLPYPIFASIHGHAAAIVVMAGQAEPSAVAEVAPPEVVDKLRHGAMAVPTTSAVAHITETALPRRIGDEQIVVLCCDPRVGDLVATWLIQSGQSVRIARDVSDAYRALSSGVSKSRALIIDQVPPTWPGIPSIRTLKQSMPLLKVVLIQQFSVDGTDMEAAVSADVSLDGPLDRFDLLDALELAE